MAYIGFTSSNQYSKQEQTLTMVQVPLMAAQINVRIAMDALFIDQKCDLRAILEARVCENGVDLQPKPQQIMNTMELSIYKHGIEDFGRNIRF